jgi:hypothetical protein
MATISGLFVSRICKASQFNLEHEKPADFTQQVLRGDSINDLLGVRLES